MANNKCISFSLPTFPVARNDLIAWCSSNVTNYVSAICDNRLKIVTSADMTTDQINAVKAYIATLTQNGEATKLALPHNLVSNDKATFENLVKAKIATLTWDALSVAQRTFSMGGTLSNSDYDALPTS
jgi:hypothetical protein